MIELYANIGIGHENDWQCIEKRIISAAQCNADAIILTKTTPILNIPENKRYVSISSKWGNLPYIEVANKSEIDLENIEKINKLTEQIGIPVIWCITDTEAGDWVKENTNCYDIKIHYDSANNKNLVNFCIDSFNTIRYPGVGNFIELLLEKYPRSVDKEKISIYHAPKKFPCTIEEINLKKITEYKNIPNIKIGYEGRCPDIFPDCAVVFKDVNYIEKYLGDEEEFNSTVLTPQKFYDFFINMNQLEIANGKN